MDNLHPLSICFFGTYREEYSRNQILLKSMRNAEINVIECHEKFWRGESDRVNAASGGWINPSFVWRAIRIYSRLLRRAFGLKNYQAILVGYPGEVDVFFGRLVAWLAHKPLIWDIYMSTYQLARERGLGQKSPFTLRLLQWVEKIGLKLPDQLILDTPAHVEWFGKTYHIPASRFWLVPAGADDTIFQPTQAKQPSGGELRVVYYGTFIPNHGVPYMIEAARLLADQPQIHFEFIGDGPQRAECEIRAQALNLQAIKFFPWMEKTELADHISQADMILGAFGQTEMSKMTVQNKIYEGMAMARPVITGDSPAIAQAFENGKHLLACDRSDPQSLANAIMTLANDPGLRERIAAEGHEEYLCHYTTRILGRRLQEYLVSIVS